MDYPITAAKVGAQPIAAARQRATFHLVSNEIGDLLGRPWAFLQQHPGLRTDGQNVAVYGEDTGAGSIVTPFREVYGDWSDHPAQLRGRFLSLGTFAIR